MLIGFVGSPCCGKTTIASKLFSSLKEMGITSELLVEQARYYIANKKVECKKTNVPFSLNDFDQQKIMDQQFLLENTFKESCKENEVPTIILTDSSVYNALLYVDKLPSSGQVMDYKGAYNKFRKHYDLIIFCHPISLKHLPSDSNRVHDMDQINKIQDKTLILLDKLKSNGENVFECHSYPSIQQRFLDCSRVIMDQYTKLLE